MKTPLKFVPVIYLLTLSLLAGGDESPDLSNARQVLAQFAESRKNLSSFIVKVHEKGTFTYTGFKGTGTGYRKHEWRFDGQHCKNITYLWGDISIRDRNVKEGDADYLSRLWDGQTAYIFDKQNFRSEGRGNVIISKQSDPGDHEKVCSESFKMTYFGEIMGYHWGDYIPFHELFLKPSVILRLREKRNNVRGVDCYVIEAAVPDKGNYTVWIDPVHDFHIARIRVQRKSGDVAFDQRLGDNATMKELFEVLEFEKSGEVWLPKICTSKHDLDSDDINGSEKREITFTQIILDPDHKELGSFLPDDIPNGTQVYFRALPSNQTFNWQDGKVVDSEGKVIYESLIRKIQPEEKD